MPETVEEFSYVDEILENPWDIAAPTFTLRTRMVRTFMRFLEQPDSKSYELEMDWNQVRIRLVGPNANELILRVNRSWNGNHGRPTSALCKELVQALRQYPQKGGMDSSMRTRLAAQVAMFLDV